MKVCVVEHCKETVSGGLLSSTVEIGRIGEQTAIGILYKKKDSQIYNG